MYHSWVMDGRMRRLILKDVLKEKSRYAGGRHIYIYASKHGVEESSLGKYSKRLARAKESFQKC